ncbi:MAG: lactonase family protein, partial [Kofleriaceae bacterium]
ILRAMLRAAVVLSLVACAGKNPVSPEAGPSDAAHDAGPPAHVVAYISGYGPDLAWFDLDPATGALAPVGSVAAFASNPSFLAMTQTHLYAASEGGSRVGAYAIDQATGALTFINDVASSGNGPAHVSVSGGFVLVANYDAGSVAVLPTRSDGGVMPASQTLAAGGNAHQIVADPTGAFVLVPCKGADYVAQYTFAAGTLTPNATPRATTAAGAGPRHLALAGDHAYLVNELDSTLTVFTFAAGRLAPIQTVSTRAPGATGTNTGAEVAISGRFVYTSNRGDDDLAVFEIGATGTVTLVGNTPTGGNTPRIFAIDPSGRWLFAGNQNSSTVTTFSIDTTTGMPTPTGASLDITSPAFIGFVALPR